MKKLLLLILLGFTLNACKNSSATPHPDDPNTYGEALSEQTITPYGELVNQLTATEKIENIKVQATVESVCQAKGCWMNLVSNDAPDNPVFVKFKDYGFFVPKDLAGKEVIIEGEAYYEETSVDELRHYAEDEGKSAEEIAAITDPVRELKFMATGVKVLP